jgi:hypothetical protein
MDPFDLALAAKGVGQAVEAIADYAVNPLDAGGDEHLSKLICYGSCRNDLLSVGVAPLACAFRWG